MTYVARCEKCDKTFDYHSHIDGRNCPVFCNFCDGKAFRDVEAELAKGRGDKKKWVTDNERWSRSMGVPEASLAEYRKKYPNSTYDNKGRLLIKNRKDKLRQASERGFVELNDKK